MSSHRIFKITTKNIDIVKKDEYYESFHLGWLGFFDNKRQLKLWDESKLMFGYHFHIVASVEDKIRYALASASGNTVSVNDRIYIAKDAPNQEWLKEIINIINKVYKERLDGIIIEEIRFPELYQYDRGDGASIYEDFMGIVASDSKDLLKKVLKEENITLEEFIEDPTYLLVTDDKEHSTYEKYSKMGLIDESVIIKEYTC